MQQVQRHPLLDGYPVCVTLPVQWGEMDAYGHVNNTVLFRYFESARVAFLDRIGFLSAYEELGVGAILHSTECRFKLPLYYPDTVQVGARAEDVQTGRFTNAYRAVSLTHDAVVAEGSGIVVAFDYRSERKTALPESVLRGLEAL